MIVVISKQPLGAGGSAQTGQDGSPGIASLGNSALGNPRVMGIGVTVSAPTNITVAVSFDNAQTWFTVETLTFAGAGGQAVAIMPAPYVKITSSAAATVAAWVYTA